MEAAAIFCSYRDRGGFGASDMRDNCGTITDADGGSIGRISYNGRIWDANGNPLTLHPDVRFQ